jgi:hypothetical protein
MSVFTSTYSYSAGEYIKAKVEGMNSIGWSPLSDANVDSVIAKTVPLAPISLTSVSLTITSINLSWGRVSTLAQTGYQAVTDYKIMSNGGSGSTFTVLRSTTGNAITIDIENLTSGSTYIFKVLAVNKFGNGLESTQSSILVALIPGQMSKIVSTEIEVPASSTKNIDFSWNLPSEYGSPIVEYDIVFYSVTSTGYSEHTSL